MTAADNDGKTPAQYLQEKACGLFNLRTIRNLKNHQHYSQGLLSMFIVKPRKNL